jgi:hypothetical protein
MTTDWTPEAVLERAAMAPCACGRRSIADRQEIVSPIDCVTELHELITGEPGIAVIAKCKMKCLVCSDVHKFSACQVYSKLGWDILHGLDTSS